MNIQSWLRQKLGRRSGSDAPETLILNEQEFVLLDIDVTGTDIANDSVLGFAILPMINRCVRLNELHYYRFPETPANAATNDYREMLDLLVGRLVFTVNPRFVHHMLNKTCQHLKLPLPEENWHDLVDFSRALGNANEPVIDPLYWQHNMRSNGRQEHDATYDVFAMAQFLQALLAYAEEMEIRTLADLLSNQHASHWLRPY